MTTPSTIPDADDALLGMADRKAVRAALEAVDGGG